MSGHGSPGRHLSSLGPGEPGVTGPGAAGFRERFASPGPQEAVWAKRSLPAASCWVSARQPASRHQGTGERLAGERRAGPMGTRRPS